MQKESIVTIHIIGWKWKLTCNRSGKGPANPNPTQESDVKVLTPEDEGDEKTNETESETSDEKRVAPGKVSNLQGDLLR
jgi:hypothetical protein